jgi:hypothetical protein
MEETNAKSSIITVINIAETAANTTSSGSGERSLGTSSDVELK